MQYQKVFAKDFNDTYFAEHLLVVPSEPRMIVANLSLLIRINYNLLKESVFHQLFKASLKLCQSFFTSQDIKQFYIFKFEFRQEDVIYFRIYLHSGTLMNSAMAERGKTGRGKYELLNNL